MNSIKGRVERVESKDWNKIKLWSFQIEGDSRWFKTGTTEPKMSVGTVISFSEGNGKVDMSTLKELSPDEAPAIAAAIVPGARTPVIGREEYWTRREQRDTEWESRRRRADARRDAAQVVIAALQTDHLPHAANITKAKRLDLLVGYVKELTNVFLEDETNG